MKNDWKKNNQTTRAQGLRDSSVAKSNKDVKAHELKIKGLRNTNQRDYRQNAPVQNMNLAVINHENYIADN